MNIPKIDPSILPSGKKIIRDIYLLLPMLIVLVLILKRYSPPYAAFWSIVSAVVLMFIRDFRTPKSVVLNFKKSLVEGATNLSGVATGLACAGIITGVVTLTGLGNKFVDLVILISGGQPFLALVLIAVACLVLGMGLPTSAAYVITATMAIRAMVAMDLPSFACHLFVFYFAVIAPVTPPVAIAAYAGAGIADASPNKTGIQSFIFALPAFLMPFMFVYNPLLLFEGEFVQCLIAGATSIIGAVAVGACTQGYLITTLGLISRIVIGTSAMLLIHPGMVTDIIGLIGISGVAAYNVLKRPSK